MKPQYLLDGRLGGPQIRCGPGRNGVRILDTTWTQTLTLQLSITLQVAIALSHVMEEFKIISFFMRCLNVKIQIRKPNEVMIIVQVLFSAYKEENAFKRNLHHVYYLKWVSSFLK
jgi:hypothetical protein